MADTITITAEQQEYLVSIVDNWLNLHKSMNKHLCIQPEKRLDKDGNTICDGECEACTNELYEKRREAILKRAGLLKETE